MSNFKADANGRSAIRSKKFSKRNIRSMMVRAVMLNRELERGVSLERVTEGQLVRILRYSNHDTSGINLGIPVSRRNSLQAAHSRRIIKNKIAYRELYQVKFAI
jgi:hypothetical protein